MLIAATMDISEIRRELHQLHKRLAHQHVVYVTRHKQPAFAVVATEYLEAVLETLEILADPEMAEMLRSSIRDIRDGRVFSHDELEAEFG